MYSLSLVLNKVFLLSLLNTIGLTVFYGLVCVVYLAAYYSAMFRTDIVIDGKHPLKDLRWDRY